MMKNNKQGLCLEEIFGIALSALIFSVGIFFVGLFVMEINIQEHSLFSMWGAYSMIFIIVCSVMLCKKCVKRF